MNARNIDLHIEELVLDAFAPSDRHAIADAFQREMTVLLAERELPSALADNGVVPHAAATLDMPAGATPAEVGRQIARSIHGGIFR